MLIIAVYVNFHVSALAPGDHRNPTPTVTLSLSLLRLCMSALISTVREKSSLSVSR